MKPRKLLLSVLLLGMFASVGQAQTLVPGQEDIKFTGTATFDIGIVASYPYGAACAIVVEEIISGGPQYSVADQLLIFVLPGTPSSTSYIYTEMKEGDKVEVFGSFIERGVPGLEYQYFVSISESKHYIRNADLATPREDDIIDREDSTILVEGMEAVDVTALLKRTSPRTATLKITISPRQSQTAQGELVQWFIPHASSASVLFQNTKTAGTVVLGYDEDVSVLSYDIFYVYPGGYGGTSSEYVRVSTEGADLGFFGQVLLDSINLGLALANVPMPFLSTTIASLNSLMYTNIAPEAVSEYLKDNNKYDQCPIAWPPQRRFDAPTPGLYNPNYVEIEIVLEFEGAGDRPIHLYVKLPLRCIFGGPTPGYIVGTEMEIINNAPELLPVEIDDSDNGTAVTVDIGDTVVVRLQENPSTGYTWTRYLLDETILRSLGEVHTSEQPMLFGAGGTVEFEFKAISSGSTRLEYVYSRPWEDVVGKTFSVLIIVR